jgi:hypothetical protein
MTTAAKMMLRIEVLLGWCSRRSASRHTASATVTKINARAPTRFLVSRKIRWGTNMRLAIIHLGFIGVPRQRLIAFSSPKDLERAEAEG